MDLNARVYVNCGRKDGRTENRAPISHFGKVGATEKDKTNMRTHRNSNTEIPEQKKHIS